LIADISRTLIQVILKQYIGGFRPNFLDICRPAIINAVAIGYSREFYPVSVCQGMSPSVQTSNWWIQYGLQSFPSGHTTSAFSVGLFLSLYINAKLKVFAEYSASF
jgi:diacylglycerol diphosphate phosphatase/phosphatidate phosphatase